MLCATPAADPTPVRNSRKIAIGTLTRLKNGAPTVILLPLSPLGKHRKHRAPENREAGHQQHEVVEHKAAFARHHRAHLVFGSSDTADRSRIRYSAPGHRHDDERHESSRRCRTWQTRERSRPGRCASASCQRSTSCRPAMISTMFQTFSMPFFSCTITECRKAVPISHGISEAFSTGSQAQKPPHPSS